MLIDSCLSSLPMYMMVLYTLSEGIHASFDKELSRFFWQGSDGRQKYHMVKWADLCTPKYRGGIGILSSRKMNKALMLRWVWRILREEGGLWLHIIKAKYLQGRPLLACDRQDGSQFWRAIQAIKHEIRMGARFSIGDGEGTLFWHDPWMDDLPLRVKFPSLFAICSDPAQLVASTVHNGS